MPVATRFSSTPQVAAPSRPQSAGSSRLLALRAAGVLLVSVGAAAAVGTLTAGPGAPAPTRPQPRVPELAVPAVPAVQAASFSILRRPRTASDDFASIRAGAGPFGANAALARTALAPGAAAGPLAPRLISVVPARGHVCLRLLMAGGSAEWWCQETALAARGRLFVALLPASPTPDPRSEQFLIGLVPNGVSSVTVKGSDGIGHNLAVRSIVFARATYAPRSVAFQLPGRGAVNYRIRI